VGGYEWVNRVGPEGVPGVARKLGWEEADTAETLVHPRLFVDFAQVEPIRKGALPRVSWKEISGVRCHNRQGDDMARRGYPPEFRGRVLALVEAGRKVAEVAADLGISEQTIYTWRRHQGLLRRARGHRRR